MCIVQLPPGGNPIAVNKYIISYHFCVFQVHRICSNKSIRGRSIRMRWVGHVARMGDRRGAYVMLVGDLRERDHLEYLGLDERIILKWIFKNWDRESWTGLIWLRLGTGGRRF
jgi:hypothetical protein